MLNVLFDGGIANELFPLLLFIGIGAMIDFEPLLTNPKLMLFGAAAQFGIFATLVGASLLGFPLKDAASIAIIGAADGPTSIFVANYLHSNFLGPISAKTWSSLPSSRTRVAVNPRRRRACSSAVMRNTGAGSKCTSS